MASLQDYFAINRSKPKWHLGDRVFGFYNKIPFIGTVLLDNLVWEDKGARVLVHLDLPLKHESVYRTIIEVKQKDLKKLTNF